MIIKVLSNKSNTDRLLKYIFKEQSGYWENKQASKSSGKWYVPGIKLTPKDIKWLNREREDALLLKELKSFKGTLQQFIEHKLNGKKANAEKDKGQKPLLIKHNVLARSLSGFCREFSENDARRLTKRSDQVRAYHVIVSWAPGDAKHLTDDILKKMADEFIRLRGSNCMVVGTKHVEGINHVHLHLAVSGTMLNGKSSRISKSELYGIKKQLQEYQQKHYPFLSSLPEHGKGKNGKEVSEKNKIERRSSEKQALLQCLDEAFKGAESSEQFISRLKELGHVPYYRNGKLQGIKFGGPDGRKHRIYRYGFTEEKLNSLDILKEKAEKQLKNLKQLRESKRSNEKIRDNVKEEATRDILLTETIDPKLQDKKRELQQQLINVGRKFEKNEESLNELKDLREKTNPKRTLDKPIVKTNDKQNSKEDLLQELRAIRVRQVSHKDLDSEDNDRHEADLDATHDDSLSDSEREVDDTSEDGNGQEGVGSSYSGSPEDDYSAPSDSDDPS